MADKYLDHGLYASATVDSTHWSTSTTTLTVSSGAVVTGQLGVGANISGGGLAEDTVITALGTGLGGVGTYTISPSQTIASPGAELTAKYCHPQNIPVWGTAQDGDGSGTGVATPATVAIDMTSMTAVAGNTIAIGGAVLTCVSSGATTNQFNAGSGSTLVENLVSAINRTTNTSLVQAAATGWTTPKVQDFCFARANPSTTLEIMTRAGSATYNANSLSQIALAGFTGGAGPYQFAGGAGGAWGWLFNTMSIWPSQILASGAGYGLFGITQSFAGAVIPGDNVYVRSGKTFTTTLANYSISPPVSQSTLAAPTNIVIDDGTKVAAWYGDAPNPVFSVRWKGQNSGSFVIGFTAPATRLIASTYADGTHGLQIHNIESTITSGCYTKISAASNCTVNGVLLKVDSASNTGAYNYIGWSTGAAVGSRPNFCNCTLAQSNSADEMLDLNSSYGTAILMKNIVLDNMSATAPHAGIMGPAGTNFVSEVLIQGLRCLNFLAGSKLFQGTAGIGTGQITVRDADMGNVTNNGPFVCTYAITSYTTLLNTISVFSQLPTRGMSLETRRGRTDWSPGSGFPVLGATLLDGVAKWSLRMLPSTIAGQTSVGQTHDSIPLSKINSLANGARTITIEYVMNEALTTMNTQNLFATATYVDVNGNLVYLSTHNILTPGALTASTNTGWSTWNGTKVTFVDGGTINFDRYKFVMTTPTGKDMALDSEVVVQVHIGASVSNVQQVLFVDPDMMIA